MPSQNDALRSFSAYVSTLTDDRMFDQLRQPAYVVLRRRRFADADLFVHVRAALGSDGGEFDDINFLTWEAKMDRSGSTIDLIQQLVRVAVDRLAKRDMGSPADDDPVGLALAQQGETRRTVP